MPVYLAGSRLDLVAGGGPRLRDAEPVNSLAMAWPRIAIELRRLGVPGPAASVANATLRGWIAAAAVRRYTTNSELAHALIGRAMPALHVPPGISDITAHCIRTMSVTQEPPPPLQMIRFDSLAIAAARALAEREAQAAASAAAAAEARRNRALANWARLGRLAAAEAVRTFPSSSGPAAFAIEVAEAGDLSQIRAEKGQPLFDTLLGYKIPIKWVYTTTQLLVITPYSLKGEIPHSIAANNQPVLCAGMGKWVEGDTVLEIDNWTGHYFVSKASFRVYATAAWAGVNVTRRWGPLMGQEIGAHNF